MVCSTQVAGIPFARAVGPARLPRPRRSPSVGRVTLPHTTVTAPTCSPPTGVRRRTAAPSRSTPTSGWSSRRSPPTGAARSSASSATSARVTLEDRRSKQRTFPLGPGLPARGPAGRPGRARPARARQAPTRTASGSVAVQGVKARVARASRILVEGRHDAELVEKVWGDDLRIEGVVVEYLDGVDDLGEKLRDFQPGPEPPGRRTRRPPGARFQGEPDRPVGAEVADRQARADRRPPVHRHLGGGEAASGSARRSGRRSRATSSGRRASASSSAGRTATRPTSPARGSTSSAASAASRTSTPSCSAGSRS